MILGCISLIIYVACTFRTVFANCERSGKHCCPAYLWDENLNECKRCKPGFIGPSCDLRCPYPSYGFDCQQICNCKKSFCDFQFGCIRFGGCNNGYFGPLCSQKCPYPSFGKECQKICKCENKTCDHRQGCKVAAETTVTSSISSEPNDRISSQLSTDKSVKFSHVSLFSTFINPTRVQIRLSQPTITASIAQSLSIGSAVPTREIVTENEEIVANRNSYLLIIIVSLNIFLILTVCCMLGACLYCKRKRIFHFLFQADVVENIYDKNRLQSEANISQSSAQLLNKRHDYDIEMSNMGRNSLQRFTNDNMLSVSLRQETHFQQSEYENEPDLYLVPETYEARSEYHQYLTVV